MLGFISRFGMNKNERMNEWMAPFGGLSISFISKYESFFPPIFFSSSTLRAAKLSTKAGTGHGHQHSRQSIEDSRHILVGRSAGQRAEVLGNSKNGARNGRSIVVGRMLRLNIVAGRMPRLIWTFSCQMVRVAADKASGPNLSLAVVVAVVG